ncbi:type III-E CRISPR-associated protein Csx30 [Desulfobacterales bacterium HSG2]|nr:type III-E CRISPR-associated protein Csx30 [Desulfobacterales bacterium HSG2]
MDINSYNILTDMLLEWGQVFLQEDAFPEFLSELEHEVLALEDSLYPSLKEDAARIMEGADTAGNILRLPAVIGVTPDDEEWYEVKSAFGMLDHVVCMAEAVDRMVRKKDPRLADTLVAELDERLSRATEFFYEDSFSCLRITPFNELRRNMSESVAEKHRYLFPWYNLLSREDSGILNHLTTHYHRMGNGSSGKLPEDIRERLAFYLHEIQGDSELENYLRMENALSLSLKKTFEKHWAFRLRHAARSEGYKRLLPEAVENIGIENVSRAIFSQKVVTPTERLVLGISGACFAPTIDEDRRVRILLDTEVMLKNLTIDAAADDAAVYCAKDLKKLDEKPIDAIPAAVSLLDFWFEQLEKAGTEYGDVQKDMAVLVEEMLSGQVETEVFSDDERETERDAFLTVVALVCWENIKWWKRRPSNMKGKGTKEKLMKFPGLILVSGRREENVVILLEDSDDNPPDLKKAIRNIKRNKLYCRILAQEPDGKWVRSHKELSKITKSPVKIEDPVHDRFILLVDWVKTELDYSTKFLLDALNNAGKEGQKVSPKTLVIVIEIPKTGGNDK